MSRRFLRSTLGRGRLWISGLLLLASCSTAAFADAEAPQSPQDHAAVRAVVEAFRLSIIKKDKRTFRTLFYSDAIPWLGVLTAKSLATVRSHKADAPKVNEGDTPSKFIDSLAAKPDRFEERFSNLGIDGDGDVASVHFDYSFHINGAPTNSGQELWQLIRTEAGWKINSVVYSIELNPAPQPAH